MSTKGTHVQLGEMASLESRFPFPHVLSLEPHTRWLLELLRDAKHSAALVFPRKTEGLVSVIAGAPSHPGVQESLFLSRTLSCHTALLPASLGGLINMHVQIFVQTYAFLRLGETAKLFKVVASRFFSIL